MLNVLRAALDIIYLPYRTSLGWFSYPLDIVCIEHYTQMIVFYMCTLQAELISLKFSMGIVFRRERERERRSVLANGFQVIAPVCTAFLGITYRRQTTDKNLRLFDFFVSFCPHSL